MNSEKKLSARTITLAAVLSLCVLCGVFLLSGCTGGVSPEAPGETSAPEAPSDAVPETSDASLVPETSDAPSAVETPDDSASDVAPDQATTQPDIVFTTVDMSGNTWTDACFAGHALTVVNLWAYWCGPCVSELPDLQQLSEDYAGRGVQFLGVYDAADEAENISTVQRLGVTYPCLRYTESFDPWMDTGYIPVTIFVDGAGKVLGEARIGSNNYEGWSAVIDEYLQ